MARHHTPTTSFGGTADTIRPDVHLWRSAFGPGYAIGPSGRLVDYVARASAAASEA